MPLAPWLTARLIGTAHQASSRLNTSVTAIAARPVRTSLIASHRVRVTDWFQARAEVPLSSSRAISGAPQNRPMTAGARRMTTMPSWYTTQ